MDISVAAKTLEGMFPQIKPGVILLVLESNGGHMEHSIEALLSMSEPSATDAEASTAPDSADPGPSVVGSIALAPSTGVRNPLPDDFLRVPGSATSGTTSAAQQAQDAALAQMMVDDLFMDELRSNPEFSRYLGLEAQVLPVCPQCAERVCVP